MATFKPYISANTLLRSIISNELSEDFPFGARKLPLKKRFKHALFLTNEGLRTVEDLARFVRANEFDIEVYASLESQREIYAILHACYPAERFDFSHTVRIHYTAQNDLSYPWAEFNLLYNNLYTKISSKDFDPDHCYKVEQALDLLNELERSIIELRYGFGEHELPTTCAEIAMLYKIEDEFVSENEVQFFINDCLKIMSTGKNTEKALQKSVEDNARLEKALQESAEDNAKLKAGLIKLAEANKQLESDSSYYWKRANSLNDEIVDLEEKLKDLEIQLKEKTIKLANANLAIESSKKALADSIYTCEQLRQVGPTKLEIYQIAQVSLQKKAKDDPITTEAYESQLPISEAAHKFLEKRMCFTYKQILQLITEEGWKLMASRRMRPMITEIMFAINYDPEIKQASIDSIGLSTRSFNALYRRGYETTEDIKQAAINGKLYEVRNLGAQSLEEVLIKTGLKADLE